LESYDIKTPPLIGSPPPKNDVKIGNKQWFTAILPCSNLEQLLYCHLDYPPQGLWVMDITDNKQIQRTYPSASTLIYDTKEFTLKNPTFVLLHMYRDTSDGEVYRMPTRAVCGFIESNKLEAVMTNEMRKLSSDVTAMVDAISSTLAGLDN
jgi:hypothetical protein